jgi:hypothetical protein
MPRWGASCERSRIVPTPSLPHRRLASTALIAFTLLPFEPVFAQEALRPGEAYVTRFSGVAPVSGAGNDQTFTINLDGTVGSIIDIRSPGQPPQGQHWIDEPQRLPVTARQVGQVFGVALDGNIPPNVYVTSTPAFGIHRTPDNRDWTAGMWGPGGPGAIYKLDATNRYQPKLFATISLDGRPNSAPALGNIAYDKWHNQFFVSDLETGMIHRIDLQGADRGRFDHGTQGRASFVDGQTRQRLSLPAIAFDPASRARIFDCPAQPFDTTPACWNFAASNRRIWGLGVHDDGKGKVRLYYAVWSGPDFDPEAWNGFSEQEKRNSVWSVGLGSDGAFDASDVRREFVLPDFFVSPADIARAGYSHPASDISFPTCSNQPIMLVAERGGIRNLGVAAENSFAAPHESRVIRYELDQNGAWRPVGRYDIGFYDRQKDGPPFINANCAGGAAFGPGYGSQGQTDPSQPDQFVWITGDSLCSPEGPCNLPAGQAAAEPSNQVQPASERPQPQGDDSEVHGLQGMRAAAIAELAPATAYSQTEQKQQTPTVVGINEAYLIDTDINVDPSGNPIPEELTRNDATTIGDVAIYQVCTPGYAAQPVALLPAPPQVASESPPVWEGHPVELSHAEYASHGVELSHYRWGSHYALMSHSRWRTHSEYWSHDWIRSHWHNPYWSHWPYLSHQQWRSVRHDPELSWRHDRYLSPRHYRDLSPRHREYLSPRHERPLSPGHHRDLSPSHRAPLSPGHHTDLSPGRHRTPLSPNHNRILSPGTFHKLPMSPGHSITLSPGRPPGGPAHNRVLSPRHDAIASRGASGGTGTGVLSGGECHTSGGKTICTNTSGWTCSTTAGSCDPKPPEVTVINSGQCATLNGKRTCSTGPTQYCVNGKCSTTPPSWFKPGTTAPIHSSVLSPRHNPTSSSGGTMVHHPDVSRGTMPHNAVLSRGTTTPHNAVLSQGTTHNAVQSKGTMTHHPDVSRGTTTHNAVQSRGTTTHNAVQSRGVTTHNAVQSRGTTKTHSAVQSRGTTKTHSAVQSRGTMTHHADLSRRTTTTTKKSTTTHKPTTYKKPTTTYKPTTIHRPTRTYQKPTTTHRQTTTVQRPTTTFHPTNRGGSRCPPGRRC